MKSLTRGTDISKLEVTNIDSHGFWLFVGSREHFLAYADFPWFKDAKVSDILNVQLLHRNHLHWPSLDVDIELESLAKPDKYPLVYSISRSSAAAVREKKRRRA